MPGQSNCRSNSFLNRRLLVPLMGKRVVQFVMLLAMVCREAFSFINLIQPSMGSSNQVQFTPLCHMSLAVDSDETVGANIDALQPIPSQHLSRSQSDEADNRPYEQRAAGPRLARRMNHAFKYLYRHHQHDGQDCGNITGNYETMSSVDYLLQYFHMDEIFAMNQSFPPLLELNVSRHLHPKVRFLQETMGYSLASPSTSSMTDDPAETATSGNAACDTIPPQYFGARLERTIAPRHAFLVYQGLPSGPELMEQGASKWKDFLLACRKTKRFAALCNQWRREQQQTETSTPQTTGMITSKQIEAFDAMFGRGILAAARGELVQHNNTWPLQYMPNLTSAELVDLLVRHGANPLELDNRGVSLLHWAAGTGNLQAVQVLLPYFGTEHQASVLERASRDGATPLHWAAAGATAREFGTGGHIDVCRYLINACTSTANIRNQYDHLDEPVPLRISPTRLPRTTCSAKELINTLTYDGNSALMWAAWSGTLETVKLMIRHRADPNVANRNGCTVAHWAASGGNVEVCQYLANVMNVDFFQPNHGGNTPLTHAVAFGRVEVVDWLRQYQQEIYGDDADFVDSDKMAVSLAKDFVGWTGGDDKRRNQVLRLFQDDYWYDGNAEENDGGGIDDDLEF